MGEDVSSPHSHGKNVSVYVMLVQWGGSSQGTPSLVVSKVSLLITRVEQVSVKVVLLLPVHVELQFYGAIGDLT